MATLEQLSSALVKADAAGNVADAKALADAIRQMQSAPAVEVAPAPAPRQPGFLTQLGRSAASLADVTVGGVLPAVAQQVVYPFARVGSTPAQAQATTARIVGGLEKPFGKTFGVADTPEYQQEAGRQVLDFIGENFQKGAKWIAEKTGIPQSDVENYMGTASLAAPKVAPTVARTVQKAAAPVIEKAVIGAKMPFEPRRQAKRERQSLEDYARGPQIDAAADAQRLGIALNPVDIEPSAGARLTTTMAGEKGVEAITNANKNQVRNVVLGELDLPPTTQLNGGAAFDQARAKVAAPYDEVSRLPTIVADDAGRAALDRLRPDETLIGSDKYAQNINTIIDDALAKTGAGLNGAQLLDNVKTLRQRARKTYNNKNADLAALDVADTNLAVANALESMIESNISNPKLLDQFRDARQKMAKTYAYEGATDFNTGMVDVKKLARITSKDNALTGDIAALGRIAGNFPEAFTSKAASPWSKALSIGRTGAAGTLGGVAGYALGQDYISAAAGTLMGAGAGKLGESFAANRMASPGYQAGLKLRDARIPVNQLAASMQPIPQNRAIVPYEAPVEVLGPGEGPYQPNFVMRPNQYDRVVPGTPEAPRNMLGYDPNAPVQGQPGAFDIMRQRERDLSMRQGTAAEQQAAAAEAAARQSARNAQVIDIDPVTGKMIVGAEGTRGLTPNIQIIESTGKNLSGAADLLSSGKSPALMSAEQKIAWDKTKVDLAEVVPGMKTLNDKVLASKILDRQWLQETIDKAKQKAQMYADIAARSENERLRQEAMMKREVLNGTLEMLEEQYRKARPVKTGGQGPKTRAFQRNMLTPEQEIQNALAK
jgi:hypothetical protein